ncbi:MAG TPA: endolytic transglycosylase MltG [Caldilineaceae bacterium]|nr:endolytic transglycosylase MltG [Caldilineaceae bacterium]
MIVRETARTHPQSRRRLILARREAHRPSPVLEMQSLWRPEHLLTNLVRLGFLLVVLGVLAGTWVVANAHLTEQFLGAPKMADGLIDPTAGQYTLTPENIERQVLAFSLRLRERELYIPAGSNPRTRPFVINPGEPARFIAARLAAEGFIRDADLFNLYLRVTGLERRIDAGNFMLAETMTIPQIAEALQTARFEEVWVTIPEGFRAEEIAERLAENNVIEPDRFLAAVRAPRSLSIFENYDFLQELPPDASLEGYLFPDTYLFPVFAGEPELVLASFLDNFEAKVGSSGLVGGASGISGRNLITLASIVEREAVQADERPLIASVYLNRLNGVCAQEVGGNYLQADPTVQYARGTVGNWWWKPERIEEYASVVSPYNTYLNPGLPPGPIASPGLSAIEATRNPATSAYCFFVATGDEGRHVFAQTLAEHQQNLQLYGYQ